MDIEIRNIFKSSRAKAGRPAGPIHNPFRDWRIAVVSFLVVNALIVAGSLYLFWLINSGAMFESGTGEQLGSESLDRGDLRRVVADFEVRRAKFEELKAGKVFSVDPSL